MNENSGQDAPAVTQLSAYLTQPTVGCELCEVPGGELLWEDDFCRVISVKDGDYPGFCRVILRQHCREMSDLTDDAQIKLMRVVFAVEAALRTVYQPDKINLASFGNVVPHLHWHVVPRWHDDRHFPQPVWGTPQRVSSVARPLVSSRRLAEEIRAKVAA
jgi:diadenosine tetraphosphate (Ap4A) HIT family hydrolase